MKRLIYYILILILSIMSIILAFNATIIPNKVLYLVTIFYVINLILIFILITRKKKFLRIIGIIISLLLLLANAVMVFVYFKADSFFDKITNVEYETSNYSVVILNDAAYKELADLTNIGIYNNELDKNYSLALEELNEKNKIYNETYESILELVTNLLDRKVGAILINENYIDIINETTKDFKDKTKVLDTLSIKSIKEKKELEKEIKKLGNFNIYISGIDTYGEISTVSRSDVNIIATIDMQNHKILLTNTPRDYYVQLHGTTGTKDKLTHAGVYGIDMSMQTLEDLYNTNIDYYVRVNFNTLISLVDEIGGIDINSDLAFVPWTNKSVYIKYGWNHLNGKEALAYARERYSYSDGDRHRGRNQQQVIEAIIKKVTESNDINMYMKLLNVLEKSMQTNMDKKLINGFINLQVKDNFNWEVESIQVTGYDDGGYTYSYPGQYLYVMQPDYNSLEIAKNRINEILSKNGE